MDDVTAITQLVLRERYGRDRLRWDWMRDAWEPEGAVQISWFSGSTKGFIDASCAMSERGVGATHRLAPPVVQCVGDRAVVEVPAVIEMRVVLGGAEVDLASRVRLMYRARRGERGWALHTMTCVYESDAIAPVTPGDVPDLGELRDVGARPSYRWLATYLAASGYEIAHDVAGEDRPDTVDRLEHEHRAWLDEAGTNA